MARLRRRHGSLSNIEEEKRDRAYGLLKKTSLWRASEEGGISGDGGGEMQRSLWGLAAESKGGLK